MYGSNVGAMMQGCFKMCVFIRDITIFPNEQTCSLQLSDSVPYGHASSGCSLNLCQKRAIMGMLCLASCCKIHGVRKFATQTSLFTFSEQARTNGHSQTGPAFRDLTSGWKQPESDNQRLYPCRSDRHMSTMYQYTRVNSLSPGLHYVPIINSIYFMYRIIIDKVIPLRSGYHQLGVIHH